MLISFPKLLIAAVNGPVSGFGVSLLTLCDIVYSAEKVSYHVVIYT